MTTELKDVESIGVVGSGLMGGSVLRSVSARLPSWRRIVVDLDRERLRTVADNGWAHEAHEDLDALSACDLIVVCTPPHAIPGILVRASHSLKDTAVVTDVGSTKRSIVSRIEGLLPPEFPYVAAHPMAGSDKSGPEHSVGDLFAGRVCMLLPRPGNRRRDIERVGRFWAALGAEVVTTNPTEHDRSAGLTSHFLHLLVFALTDYIGSQLDQNAVQPTFVGTALEEVARIGNANPEMWSQIFAENSEYVLAFADDFQRRLHDWRTLVDSNDPNRLSTAIKRANVGAALIGSR